MRAKYIYTVWDTLRIVGTFTVKRECLNAIIRKYGENVSYLQLTRFADGMFSEPEIMNLREELEKHKVQ